MEKQELLESIKLDLGANFKDDSQVLENLFDEVLNDALFISNRKTLYETDEKQLDVLASNIRRCVKTIYLQRGAEDVTSSSTSGISNTFDDAIERMKADIIKQGKRLLK